MSNNTEEADITPKATRALVPELRFPEFRDAGEWEEKVLAQVCEINPPTKDLPDYFIYIDLESVEAGKLAQEKVISLKEAPSRAQRLLKRGDVLFQTVRPYQKNNYFFQPNNDLGYVASTGYAQLRARESNMYLFQYLHNDRFVARVLAKCTGSNYPAINSSDLSEITIEIPNFKEQQKIADCLSSIDELIALEARKIDALKVHKKGLMQQLFPAEGETLPELRFPEFRDAGEWKMRALSEFITERNQYPKERVPLFSLTIEDGVTPKTERYERSFLVNNREGAYKLVLPDDFAYNPMNLRFGAIGRHAGAENVALSKYYNIFYCDESVDSRFCEIYFKSDGMISFYDNMASGSLIEKRRVHFNDFMKFTIRFPVLTEQQKIADCLTSVDDLITLESQKLDALKAHKKGLLQQLFPSLDERPFHHTQFQEETEAAGA